MTDNPADVRAFLQRGIEDARAAGRPDNVARLEAELALYDEQPAPTDDTGEVMPVAADWTVIEGDCVEQMAKMDSESVDAVVCDP